MKNAYFVYILTSVLLFACTGKGPALSESNNIALINLGGASRVVVAEGLQTLSDCGAKVVAINTIFKDFAGTAEDSLLLKTIRQAENVVLVCDVTEDGFIASDSVFMNASLGHGVLDVIWDEDGLLAGYRGFASYDDRVLWSFPVSVLGYYRPETTESLLYSMETDTYYAIEITRRPSASQIYSVESIQDVPCDEFRGKLVLMGYLGPDPERDSYVMRTKSGEDLFYSTELIWSIINELSENDFRPLDTRPDAALR